MFLLELDHNPRRRLAVQFTRGQRVRRIDVVLTAFEGLFLRKDSQDSRVCASGSKHRPALRWLAVASSQSTHPKSVRGPRDDGSLRETRHCASLRLTN